MKVNLGFMILALGPAYMRALPALTAALTELLALLPGDVGRRARKALRERKPDQRWRQMALPVPHAAGPPQIAR